VARELLQYRQVLQYQPVIGYHYIPSLTARVEHEGGGYLLRTNAAGFRSGHEFEPARRPGTRRVLLFGDSFTAGDGVSDKHRYGDVLEQKVPDLEVFNFGLTGTGPDQQYLIWREFGAGIECDLVVIGLQVENIRRVVARFQRYATRDGELLVMAKPYFLPQADGSLVLNHVPVPPDPVPTSALAPDQQGFVYRAGDADGIRRMVNRLGPQVKNALQRVTRYQTLPAYERPDDLPWQLLRAIVGKWVAEVPVPVLLVPIPLYQYVEGTCSPKPYQARYRELHDPPRLTVHDPLPDFLRHSAARRRSFQYRQDRHFTPAGHEVLAASMAPSIERLLEQGAA